MASALRGRIVPMIRAMLRHEGIVFALLLSMAIVPRGIYIQQIKTNPYSGVLPIDSRSYDEWAQQIADGDWMGDRIFYQAPLYPYLLAIVYMIFGRNLSLIRLIQIILGSLNVGVIYLVGRRTFGRSQGILAALMAVCYGPFLFYEGMILKISMVVLLVDLTLLLLLRACHRPTLGNWVGSGLIFGLSILGRGNILFVFPFIILWIILHFWGERSIKQILAYCLIFFSSVGSVMLPIALRNYAVGRDLVLTTSQGGFNFYIGNNPEATGRIMSPHGIRTIPTFEENDARKFAAQQMGIAEPKPSAVSKFYVRLAMRFIRQNPRKWLRLMVHKFSLFWSPYEIPDNVDYNSFRRYAPLLGGPVLSFAILSPLGILGILAGIRRWRKALLLYLFGIGYTLSVILFYLFSRYRLPVVPILMIFGGYGLCWLREKIRLRQYWLALPGLAMVIFLIFLNAHRARTMAGIDLDRAYWHYNLGVTLMRGGSDEEAMEEFRQAIAIFERQDEIDEHIVDAFLNLGALHWTHGQHEQAIEVSGRGLEIAPQEPALHFNRALAFQSRGEYDKAIEHYSEALWLDPDYVDAYLNAGVVYREMGEASLAIEMWTKAIELDENNVMGHYELGQAYRGLGRAEEAREEFRKAISLDKGGEYATKAREALRTSP